MTNYTVTITEAELETVQAALGRSLDARKSATRKTTAPAFDRAVYETGNAPLDDWLNARSGTGPQRKTPALKAPSPDRSKIGKPLPKLYFEIEREWNAMCKRAWAQRPAAVAA